MKAVLGTRQNFSRCATDKVGGRCSARGHAPQENRNDRCDETPAFDGVTAGGSPVTVTMSPQGTWTMFMAQGGNLCAIAGGQVKLAPDTKPKTSAPMLMPHGLRLIRG